MSGRLAGIPGANSPTHAPSLSDSRFQAIPSSSATATTMASPPGSKPRMLGRSIASTPETASARWPFVAMRIDQRLSRSK
jgi:hypothetical protein